MLTKHNGNVPPGWVGGFAGSCPAFAYPDPNLSSLPMLGNMDNIHCLQRQQSANWPEFSWLTIPGDPNSRCFQMFAPDISRIGYTDEGRVYSIICPQQGSSSPSFGTLNIEVSVLSQRGWVDEPKGELAADMTIEGKIWFSPSALQKPMVRLLWNLFANSGLPFPHDKDNAIRVSSHKYQHPEIAAFPVRDGESTLFDSPDFAKHSDEAYAVYNVEVEIGPIKKTNNPIVDEFNQMVMDIFNFASGNILQSGNLLSWNIWGATPSVVDRQEWQEHAEKWRKSIDADHGAPTGKGRPATYFNGQPFSPVENLFEQEIEKIEAFLRKHLPNLPAQ